MSQISLDHVLIAVNDLETSARTFSDRVGFTVTPEGVHPGRGTHNRLMVFENDYLELIAIRDRSEGIFRPSMDEFLTSREGLYMFALGTSNIDQTVAEVKSRGAAIQEPAEGKREASGRSPGYSWRFAPVSRKDTPGSEAFVIQHNSAIHERYVEPVNPTRHVNGAQGIHSLAIGVEDAEAAANTWANTFELQASPMEELAQESMRRVRIRLDNCWLDFVSPTDVGDLSRFLETYGEAPYLLTLKVSKLSNSATVLMQRGTSTGTQTTDGDGVGFTLRPEYAHGTHLRFIEPG